jgi:hypothetical protein
MSVAASGITVSGALVKPRDCCVLFVWTGLRVIIIKLHLASQPGWQGASQPEAASHTVQI